MNKDLKQLLTATELSEELGVKLSTVYNWTHLGYIPYVKLGRLIRFRRNSIENWLERQESRGRSKRLPRTDFQAS